MPRPMLDGVELELVQKIDASEKEVLEQHAVPVLEGDFLQDLGRRAERFELGGAVVGADAGDALKTLREKFRLATPVSFVEDIATATKIDKVMIEELGIRELAGRPQRFEYAISLREFLPPPPPKKETPPQPPPKPKPNPTPIASLEVEVIVDGQPNFDFSKVTVTLSGTKDDGTPLSQMTLTTRKDNLWMLDPSPPGSFTATATTSTDPQMTGSAPANVGLGQKTHVEIHLKPGPPVAQAFIIHFWFDRAFIEPCLRRTLRDIAAFAGAHQGQKILIVGHTDLVGSDTYNQSLSERRARSVFAYLTSGRDRSAAIGEWQQLRKPKAVLDPTINDNWGVREYQHILAGLGFYAGPISEVHDKLTDDAVRNFQKDHGLPVDGIVGDDTWTALITDYLSVDSLAIPESQFFTNCPGEILKWLGCGEQDPIKQTQDAFRPNRRTEILFVNASALPCGIPQPNTFNLSQAGAVNNGWCVGAGADPANRCCLLARGAPNPPAFFVQPAEPGTVVVQGTMTFEDGTPAAGIKFFMLAPDGEFMGGEFPSGPSAGRPIKSVTDANGAFAFPDKPKGVGVYSLSVDGPFTVRLKSDPPGSGTSSTICIKLDGSQNPDVVLAKFDGVDARHKLIGRVFDRFTGPRANTGVSIQFPDGSTASATTDDHGGFVAVMPDVFDTVNLQYQASDDPTDIVLFEQYFVNAGDIATDDGVRRRLHNLGLLLNGDLFAAVTLFQALTGLTPTGVVDDPTRQKLNTVYSGADPLVVIPPFVPQTPGDLQGDGPPETTPNIAPEPPLVDPFGGA